MNEGRNYAHLMTDHEHDGLDAGEDLAGFWEERYASADAVWSGRVNATLAEVVSTLTVGRALDLGCGEGGDAIWLAQQGWQVTAVDVSPTAIARASAAALAGGVAAEGIRWLATDLADWDAEGEFDLVCASFFHSPVDFPRTDVLRRSAKHIVAGGHLLLVSHAAFPPWSDAEAHHHVALLSPEEERAELALDPRDWVSVLVETRKREATGPEGQPAVLDDGVLLLRRENTPAHGR